MGIVGRHPIGHPCRMEKQPRVSPDTPARPLGRASNRLHHTYQGTGLFSPTVEAQVQLITKFGERLLRGHTGSPLPWTRSSWSDSSRRQQSAGSARRGDACHAVPVPPCMLREQAKLTRRTEETASVSQAKTDHEVRTIPVRRTRPDTGHCSQLCSLHRAVPVCSISVYSPQPFSSSCSGCNGLRSAPGSPNSVPDVPSCSSPHLRSFLRYLRHQGKVTIDLAVCVPTVARWSFATLPESPSRRHRTKSAGLQ